MSLVILLAAAAFGGGYSASSPDDGAHVVLSTSRPADASRDVRCRWTVYRDALPAASGVWSIKTLSPDAPVTNAAPSAFADWKTKAGDHFLRCRFVTGDPSPDKETLLSVAQIDTPRAKATRLVPYEGKPAELSASAGTYEFTTSSERIRFDRGTGLLTGFATGWWSLTEWLARPMAFDFGAPAPTVRLETFTEPTETNGVWRFKTVSWWKTSTKNFEIRVATDWQVRGDGRIVSRTFIRSFGLKRILPRIGWAFALQPVNPLVQYFGKGSPAGGTDRTFAALDGLYSSTVAACGDHARTRGVAFDAGSDHLAFSTLGNDFILEIGETPSKTTFCGIVAARAADTDRDYRLDLLISPEKTLKAMAAEEE